MYNSFRSPTYLAQNPYSYCFRIKVPKDLQKPFARKELRYSLRTGNLPEAKAKAKARLLAGQVQLIFKWLRTGNSLQMDISDSKINDLVKRFLRGLIEDYDKPAAHREYADDHEIAAFSDQNGLEEALECMDEIRDDLNLKLQSGSFKIAERKADRLLAEDGIVQDVDKSSPAYWKLCSGILRAMIRGVGYKKQRLSGKFSDELEDELESCMPGKTEPSQSEIADAQPLSIPQSTNPEPVADLPVPSKPTGKKISEVIPLFIEEKEVNWTVKYKGDMVSSLNLFVEFVGDVPIQSVDRAMVAGYKAALKKLPPRFNIKPEYRDQSVIDLIATSHKETLSSTRINKYLQRVGQLFKYAIIHGIYTGLNPATEMQLAADFLRQFYFWVLFCQRSELRIGFVA